MKTSSDCILYIRMYFFSLLLFIAMTGCQEQDSHPDPNRVYFELHPISNTMILPIMINDTLTVQMGFDTGCSTLFSFELDSTYCAEHPFYLWQQEPTIVYPNGGGIAWVSKQNKGNIRVYKDDFAVKLGETKVNYKWVQVWDRKAYFGHSDYDGLFNMPADTLHVWELNFENNYIELHPIAAFNAPEDCIVAPLHYKTDGRMMMTLPLRVKTSDGDTLTIQQNFLVDTGMSWDICLASPANELSFFEGKQAIPFHFGGGGYFNRHIVDADIFDRFHIDSLRIYTLKDWDRLPTSYLVGLNFLKRFNVFIDLKGSRMYLQPLKEFHRAISPQWKYYCISTSKTENGTYLVTEVMDHEYNSYKKAGIRVGDEIIGLNGVRLTPETSLEESKKLLKSSKVIIDVLRNGKPIRLTMERDPNEIQDD